MPISKLFLQTKVAEAYNNGYRDGQQAKLKRVENEQALELRKQQIELMEVVGKTLASLAQVYDCGPRG